jgi:hypothetical protein
VSEERRDYAVLISLAMREEAEVAAAALRADGIDAFIGNFHHAAIEWGIVPALGGVQVLVPSASLATAREALRDRISYDTPADYEPAPRRDRYKAWLALGWLCFGFLLFGANLLDRNVLEASTDYYLGQVEMRRHLLQMCADAERFINADSVIELCRSMGFR